MKKISFINRLFSIHKNNDSLIIGLKSAAENNTLKYLHAGKRLSQKPIAGIFSIGKVSFLLLLLFLLTLTLASNRKVSAQSLSLSIAPASLELMIKPGKTITQTFTLTNHGDDTYLAIYIIPFDQKGPHPEQKDKSVPWVEIISVKQTPAPSVTISPLPTLTLTPVAPTITRTGQNSQTLPSPVQPTPLPTATPSSREVQERQNSNQPLFLKNGDQLKIILKVSPPENTKEQDYYQALSFSTQSRLSGQHSQSAIQQTIISPLLIAVTKSGLKKEARITSFNLPLIVDSFSSLKPLLKVKNTGQTFFRPIGQIILNGSLGQAKYSITPRIFLVNQEKNLSFSDLPDGKISGFLLGRYRLGVNFTLDSGTITVKDERTFYALPWKAILILMAIIISIKFLSSSLKHLHTSAKKKKHPKHHSVPK